MGNQLQARAIERYHRHLQRLGRCGTLDDTARTWISRFAVLWRRHYQQIRPLTLNALP